MTVVLEAFLRRYATSPIHVPRLERLIATYAIADGPEAFLSSYLEWDRVAGDAEAARIVAEILPQLTSENGAIVRLTNEAVRGAISWLAQRGAVPLTARADLVRQILQEAVDAAV